MMKLKDCIREAEEKKVAIGHFNISNLEGFWAIVNASKKLNVPVIVGVSEGERDFVGISQVRALVDSVKKDGIDIFLNADHTFSVDRVKEVVDADFDSVIIDGAERSLEENIEMTKQSVEYAKSKNPEILVEAELGFIGKSSKILDAIPENALVSEETLTKEDDALYFVEQTGIDLFAPAVGNIHGMVKGGNPKLNIERIKAISEKVKIPLVLHGGSGITDQEFRDAIDAGIRIIHINTEIRVAYKEGVLDYLEKNKDEIAPYKYLKAGMERMQEVIESRLRLFNNI